MKEWFSRIKMPKLSKRLTKVSLIILFLTVYLNVGWLTTEYVFKNIYTKKHTEIVTPLAKFMAGPWKFFTGSETLKLKSKREISVKISVGRPILNIIWPVYLMGAILLWAIYYAHYFLWLVFAGGVVKTIGFTASVVSTTNHFIL